jgi:DNA-binding CsgD family transcriptional regulator
MTQQIRRDDEPTKPLTVVEMEIAELAGQGYGIERIAVMRNLNPNSVSSTIQRIALKLPNPDELKPLTLVMLWAAHRRWLMQLVDTNQRPAA